MTKQQQCEAFFELVAEMRRAQNQYFNRGRTQPDLIAAKQAEKKVDKILIEKV